MIMGLMARKYVLTFIVKHVDGKRCTPDEISVGLAEMCDGLTFEAQSETSDEPSIYDAELVSVDVSVVVRNTR